jgi:ABC-type nitrate/sulfonate/bicarbonate transport system substrate-binding protein
MPGSTTAKTKVSIMLDWVPNTNHIGLYVAQELGYFEEEGVEASILQPPEDGGLDFLLTGQVDLFIGGESTLFFSRDRELPVVAVAAILQENDSTIVALPSSGITSPKDFAGKRYLSYGSANEIATIRALMELDGVSNPEVTLAGSGSAADMNGLLRGDGDYVWVFRGWDLLAITLEGIEINEILMRDYDEDLNYYTPMILSTDELLQSKSSELSKAMRAIARGYEYAAANPDEAAEIFLRAVPGSNRALIVASTRHLASLYLNEDGQFGHMKQVVFERIIGWSAARGLLPNDGRNIDINKVFTNQLLVQ